MVIFVSGFSYLLVLLVSCAKGTPRICIGSYLPGLSGASGSASKTVLFHLHEPRGIQQKDLRRLSANPPGERVVNRSAVSYSPLVREWMWTFKYGGKESLAVPMGKWMAEVIREHYGRKAVSVITYVPMHGERQKQRGFNQAERLALTIGKKLWIPVHPLLKRVKETTPQSRRTRRERLHSINGVFQLADQRQAQKGRKRSVLIVDDVYTTGATVRECAKVLRNAGFQEVFSVTFAR